MCDFHSLGRGLRRRLAACSWRVAARRAATYLGRRSRLFGRLAEDEALGEPAVLFADAVAAGGAEVAANNIKLGQLAAVDFLLTKDTLLAGAKDGIEHASEHGFALGHLSLADQLLDDRL